MKIKKTKDNKYSVELEVMTTVTKVFSEESVEKLPSLRTRLKEMKEKVEKLEERINILKEIKNETKKSTDSKLG